MCSKKEDEGKPHHKDQPPSRFMIAKGEWPTTADVDPGVARRPTCGIHSSTGSISSGIWEFFYFSLLVRCRSSRGISPRWIFLPVVSCYYRYQQLVNSELRPFIGVRRKIIGVDSSRTTVLLRRLQEEGYVVIMKSNIGTPAH